LAQRAVEVKKGELERLSASGRRAGYSRRGWPCQGIHGAWQQAQATGDVGTHASGVF
jgi:hypothetical protein